MDDANQDPWLAKPSGRPSRPGVRKVEPAASDRKRETPRAPAPRDEYEAYSADAQVPALSRPGAVGEFAAFGNAQPEAPAGFDFRKYLWLALKHRWMIVGGAGACVILGLLMTLLTTPIYRATTTIKIDREAAKVINLQVVAVESNNRNFEFYQTQYELLKSRSLAENVVLKLNLQDDPEFMGVPSPTLMQRLRGVLFRAAPPTQSTASDTARREAAIGKVAFGVAVRPVSESSIVAISYDSTSAAQAARIVNALAETYISDNLNRRYSSSAYARKFLEDRLQQLKLRLEESERELVAYSAQNGIVVSGDGKDPLIVKTFSATNDALSAATSDRLRKELLWKRAQSSSGAELPEVQDNKTIETLRAKKAELSRAYQEKLPTFKPAFPEMQQIRAQITEIDAQITREINTTKSLIKAGYDAAVENERMLTGYVMELRTQVTDFRNRNIQYAILEREVNTNKTIYDGLLQQYKEIGVAGGVDTNNVAVVDAAQVPGGPYKPDLGRNLSMALMLGLAIGAGGMFLREHLDDTFKTPLEVEEALSTALLGVIPKNEEAPNASSADPRSVLAEAFRSLRTALQFSSSEGLPRVLLITSARPGEGKSVTAFSLAKSFAELGKHVLLIDADLRRPSLHSHVDGRNDLGLTNYLAGAMLPPDLFRKTAVPNLVFMASGPIPPNPAELLSGPRMLSLLNVAAQKFDVVIVDAPPVVGLADAPHLASLAAGTLFVIDATKTRKGAAAAAVKRLRTTGAFVVGVVLNKFDTVNSGYGYGYGYGDTDYYGYGERPKIEANPSLKA